MLNWDEELAEYLNSDKIISSQKISDGQYVIVLLEGTKIRVSCTLEGYICDNGNTYEFFQSLIRQKSPLYIKKFNQELNERLKKLADQNNQK